MTYADHIHQLTSKYRIPVHRSTFFDAATGYDGIHIPPVTDEESYWTALHEIGHYVNAHPLRAEYLPTIEGETEAWKWALDNAIEPPGPKTREQIGVALGAYLAGEVGGSPIWGRPRMPEFNGLSDQAQSVLREFVKPLEYWDLAAAWPEVTRGAAPPPPFLLSGYAAQAWTNYLAAAA